MDAPLRELAQHYGVELSYRDALGTTRRASRDALWAVLRALGAPLEGEADLVAAVHEARLAPWQRVLPPVVVANEGGPVLFDVHLPERRREAPLRFLVQGETGDDLVADKGTPSRVTIDAEKVEGTRFVRQRVDLGPAPAAGAYRLRAHPGDRSGLLLVAPRRAQPWPRGKEAWGAFLPLHALRGRGGWGVGDFGDLQRLFDWIVEQGGTCVATLPFLAAFLDEPCQPSPYTPVSRLFWNELHLDLADALRLPWAKRARRAAARPPAVRERRALQSMRLVDHRRAMAVKRRVLEALAEDFFAVEKSEERAAFEHWASDHPELETYARFRAAAERRREPWTSWPARQRGGDLRPGDYDEKAKRYHRFAQWLADGQVGELARRTRERGLGLLLDFPLGVHPHGYDVWKRGDLFLRGLTAGAPPDPFFTGGQNWGFPPLHPERMRQDAFRYLRAGLEGPLRAAGALRVDHVMGLHRLYCIPDGMEATEGVYLRYPAEELYAVLTLESRRRQVALVGEDLGTVPAYVRPEMARHGIARTLVLQFELEGMSADRDPLARLPRPCVASLNTHDMSPFAAFWKGRDVDDRVSLGLLDPLEARREGRRQREVRRNIVRWLAAGREGRNAGRRPTGPGTVLDALHDRLARSSASLVLVNLEDLWLEEERQNTPGTDRERPNWRRRTRTSFERFAADPTVRARLRRLARARREGTTT